MPSNPTVWDDQSKREGLHAVLTSRWSPEQCEDVNDMQRQAVWRMVAPLTGRRVLDLGCGIGRLTGDLAGEAAEVVGVDYSPGMLSRARRSVRRPNAGFVLASAVDLPFPTGNFDAVVASYVFQHILDDEEFRRGCAEAVRVLRPGGPLVCVDGIGERSFVPSTSKVTVVRTLEQYREAFGPGAELTRSEPLLCVEDAYTVMRWVRTGAGAGADV